MIPILCFQDMHDYVCLIAPVDYSVELSLCRWEFLWKLLSFHTEMIAA